VSFFSRITNALKGFAHSGNYAPWDDFWYQPVLSSVPTASQITVTNDTALTYSAVWAATRLLCGTGARLPLKLWRESDDGATRTHLRSHPLQRLLKRPNPRTNGLQFRSLMWQWQVNGGNFYSEINWNRNGDPSELWQRKPWLVTPDEDDNGTLFYKYMDEADNFRERRIEAANMLHIPSVITSDGIIGKGVITHARESIGLGQATERHGANHFGRGAIPDIVIEKAGPKFDDTQRRAFRKEWNDIYGGATGEKVAVLGGEATVKGLTISQEDSQFLETRQHNVEEIARWYGVPPHMLQHLLRATFNNIEEMGIDFVRYSLRPWMRVQEEVIEQKLLPEEDERDDMQVEHDTLEIELGNSASRSEFVRSMTGAAVMTRNEGRRLLKMNPVPGGDTFIVQGANVPLDEEGKPESDFATPSGPPMSEPDGDEEEDDEIQAGAANLVKAAMMQELLRLSELEGDRASQAAKKPHTFIAWLDRFYDGHEEHVSKAIAESITVCSALGIDCNGLAHEWCEESRNDLLEVSGQVQPEQLADAVATHVQSSAWRQRPAAVVLGLEHKNDSNNQ
jgi:HK97 family phage portal protein